MVYCAASQLATGPLRRIDRGTTMRVLITGGTGFVGYHSARALLDAGHEAKLLVRSADKMRGLYGAGALDHVVGDVTDEAAVERALEGCDAVIHSPAMVSTNARFPYPMAACQASRPFSCIRPRCRSRCRAPPPRPARPA